MALVTPSSLMATTHYAEELPILRITPRRHVTTSHITYLTLNQPSMRRAISYQIGIPNTNTCQILLPFQDINIKALHFHLHIHIPLVNSHILTRAGCRNLLAEKMLSLNLRSSSRLCGRFLFFKLHVRATFEYGADLGYARPATCLNELL